MSEISDQELRELLGDLGELEDVPDQVSKRLDGTIQQLLMQEISKSKGKKFSWGNLALAASFVLTIGLGASFLVQEVSKGNTETSTASQESNPEFKDDEILTSSGNERPTSSDDIPELKSGLDYSKLPSYENLPFIPANTYGSIARLNLELRRCVTDIGLVETVSFIDEARYEDRKIMAIWSAVSENQWQIAITDNECNPIDQLIFK